MSGEERRVIKKDKDEGEEKEIGGTKRNISASNFQT